MNTNPNPLKPVSELSVDIDNLTIEPMTFEATSQVYDLYRWQDDGGPTHEAN